MESSLHDPGASVSRGDLELALIDTGVPGRVGARPDNSPYEDHTPSGIGNISNAQVSREWT